MTAFHWQLNPFERFLFKSALVLAVVLIVVRVGALAALWYAHHVR
jgi:hypothetical protein